jgi:hypothetical protein
MSSAFPQLGSEYFNVFRLCVKRIQPKKNWEKIGLVLLPSVGNHTQVILRKMRTYQKRRKRFSYFFNSYATMHCRWDFVKAEDHLGY